MTVKYRISFVSFGFNKKHYDVEKEFNNEEHFNNYIKMCLKDESKRKIIGTEKIYSENKEYTVNELREAYKAAKGNYFNSFEEFYKNYFKRDLL